MSDDYLWDRSGTPDLDIKYLEELLAPLAHDAPLELRLAKGRRGELLRATAHEPVVAPPSSGRVKGKMNLFDKRIIGAAILTATAIGLLGVTAYKRHVDAPTPQREAFHEGPAIELARSFAMTPHASPVAPTTGADLAITAGESAWIHVPFGGVDVEIQSKCNAEVELSAVIAVRLERAAHPDDPQTASVSKTGGIIVGTDSPDGRASTYHLTPGLDPSGPGILSDRYEYTSRCVGQPSIRGSLVVDRVDTSDPIGSFTNARVYSKSFEHVIHIFGTVLPGARISIGAKPLEPADPAVDYPPIYSAFATDVPVSLDHLVATVRVDDAKGTHFYVMRASGMVVVESCATTMTAPKQMATKLDAEGDHVGALKALETAMETCKPDRETLSLALAYACKAHDAAVARSYWHKLPPEMQRTLEPICAQDEITRDQLDNR